MGDEHENVELTGEPAPNPDQRLTTIDYEKNPPTVEELLRIIEVTIKELRRHHQVVVYSLRFKWKLGKLVRVYLNDSRARKPPRG